MKKTVLLLTVVFLTAHLGFSTASAREIEQNDEKVVTGTVQLLSPGSVKILDGYISNQLYTGSDVFTGLNVKLGALYKKNNSLSWDLHYTGFNRPKWIEENGGDDLEYLTNPSKSQHLKYSSLNFGYGTYYHWKFGEKLMVKAGGMFDVYGAMKTSTPDGVNNNLNFDAQMMFKGHAAIKYGWDFKKWALDLRGSMTLPAFGLMLVSHPSETILAAIGGSDHNVLKREFRHTFLASYHNYMSLDYEIGIDFVLRPCTISLGFCSINKWWEAYDLPYFCKINCTTVGISFDLVSRNKFKTSNINF
jgi:hypothetical protein